MSALIDDNLLLDILHNGVNEIYIFDSSTLLFQYANNAALKNLGYTLEELQKKTPLDIKPIFNKDLFLKKLKRLNAKKGDKEVFETDHIRKDGSTYPVEVHLQYSENGDRKSYLAIILDISQRKKSAKELRNTNTRLKQTAKKLLKQTSELQSLKRSLNKSMIVMITDVKGVLIHANKELCRLSGYKKSEILGKNLNILNSDHHSPDFWQKMWSNISEGRKWRSEVRNKTKDGGFFWLDMVINPIVDHGKITGYLGLGYSIDEKKRLEAEQQESLELLSIATSGANIGVWSWDIKSNETYWDKQSLKILEVSQKTKQNFESWFNLLHPDDKEPIKNYIDECLKEKRDLSFVFRIITRIGKIKYIESRAKLLLTSEGSPHRYLGVNFDKTDEVVTNIELESTNEKLKLALEASGNGYFDLDMISNKTVWSRQIYKMLGLRPRGTEDPEYFKQLIHPDDREMVLGNLNHAKKNKTNFDITSRRRHKRGHYIHTRVKGRFLYNESGEPIRMIGIISDLTREIQAEQELKEKERQYRMLVENSYELTCEHTPEGIYTYVSPSAYYLLGYTPRELIGKDPYEFIHPDDQERVKEKSHNVALKNQEPPLIEYRYRIKSGSYKWLSSFTNVNKDENGNILSLITKSRDVTDKVEINNALKTSEEKYRLLAEQSTDGIAVFEKQKLTYISPSFQKSLGIKSSQLKEFSFNDLLRRAYAEDKKKISQTVERAWAHEKQSLRYIYRVRSGKASYRFLEDVLKIDYDKGTPTKITIRSRDITELQQALQSLKESQETLTGITSSIPGILMQYILYPDHTDEVGFLSTGAEKLWEEKDEDVYKDVNVLWNKIHPEDLQNARKSVLESAKTMSDWRQDFRLLLDDGKVKWISGQGSPMKRKDGAVVWNSIFIDITDKKALELENQEYQQRLEKALYDKNTLFRELHHRIKNNLQLISSILYVRASSESREEIREFIRETNIRIQSITNMHEQLLQIQKTDKLDIRDYINRLVSDLLTSYSEYSGQYAIEANIESHELKVDQALTIGLILNEIVSNIIKHAYTEKTGKIILKFVKRKNHYLFSVKDGGKGLEDLNDKTFIQSHGIRLIHILTKQLNGDIEMNGQNGMSYVIFIPTDQGSD